ncbi:hypothetical protein DF039_20970 [Burkholderia cenocepacia]|nr:hypothetical protein DF039_20970 [Burkholderia cenocepacia]
MKSWKEWCLAVLLSIGASSAFADGSCQQGFSLRSYPFYDKAGAYIGMRQACAPIPCTPGYQDSTCAAPLRNGVIPQPQCQSGAGWTTVAASVWQGSRWSQPQCNYAAPPGCPSGWGTASPATWTGTNWTTPVCTAPAQNPSTRDWATICNDYLVKTRTSPIWRYTFKTSDFHPFTFGTGVAVMMGGDWGTGPNYVDGNYSGNDWDYMCAVRVDDGTVYQFTTTPESGYQGG